MASIDRVDDRLCISNATVVTTPNGHEIMREYGITHVLSVTSWSISDDVRITGVVYSSVPLLDVPTENILIYDRLENMLQFIEDALRASIDNVVLVHCEKGISRSATIIAAFLMRKYRLSASTVLDRLKAVRPIICPNDGFVRQLELFEMLEYRADAATLASCRAYRNWCIESGWRDIHDFNDYNAAAEAEQIAVSDQVYRCYRCRKSLFARSHLIEHKSLSDDPCTFGYLLEPLKWMKFEDNQPSGKIFCPNCNEKLGQYKWSGQFCYGSANAKCEQHISPWILVHKSKIDKMLTGATAFDANVSSFYDQ